MMKVNCHTHQGVEVCHERCPSLIAGEKQAEVMLCLVWWQSLLVPEGPSKAEAQLLVNQHHSLHGARREEGGLCGCLLFLPI